MREEVVNEGEMCVAIASCAGWQSPCARPNKYQVPQVVNNGGAHATETHCDEAPLQNWRRACSSRLSTAPSCGVAIPQSRAASARSFAVARAAPL